MRLSLILVLLVAAQEAPAQETPAQEAPAQGALTQVQVPPPPEALPPLVQAPDEPEPPPLLPTNGPPIVLMRGDRIRVETARGQRRSGELLSLASDALSLQADPQQVVTLLLSDVQRLEERKRAPWQGALIGTGVGGLSGGLFLSLICASTLELGDSVLPCTIAGALIGSVIGAASGTLLGLVVPRWSTVYEKGEQGPLSLRLEEPEEVGALSRWFSAAGPLGEVGLRFGYARDMGISRPTGGWGGRLHVLALIGPYIAVGPEVAWYSNVGSERILVGNGQVSMVERSLFQLGGLARIGVEVGPTRTSLLAGLALYENRQGTAGASVGGEVEVRLWERLPPVAVDVRYHVNIDESLFNPNYLTFGAGTRLRW